MKIKVCAEVNLGSMTCPTVSHLISGGGSISGDIVTFDNWRLLHGRKSYISRLERLRHLEGCYLDWDEVMSRLRILRKAVHEDL